MLLCLLAGSPLHAQRCLVLLQGLEQGVPSVTTCRLLCLASGSGMSAPALPRYWREC